MMNSDYYVYLHSKPNGQLFYVGKGRRDRAYVKSSRSAAWLDAASEGFSVEIYANNLTEVEALEIEKSLIQALPGLVNKYTSSPIYFSDYSDYFEVDTTSESGLSRKAGTYTGTYYKGQLGPCGYKAKRKDGQQFWRIKYKNKSVQVHRIIWEVVHGAIPDRMVIDHIDGNSLNNQLENLRLVTQEWNCRNRRKNRNNSSGFNGVLIDKFSCRAVWNDIAGASKSKRFNIKSLGFDEALKQAAEFRKAKELEIGYSETHGT